MSFRILFLAAAGFTVLIWLNICPAATFRDALNRTVVLNSPPVRIVSLAPSLTEILYCLGLGDRIVGVSQFSCYPPEATSKPRVGSYNDLNVERIITLDPDLAIGTVDGNREGEIRFLEQAGIPVYIVNPRNVIEAIVTIKTLGDLCGVGEKAEELSSRLNRRVNHIFEKTKPLTRPLVFLQINLKPIMTVNRNTFHHDVIRLAGGENMAQDEPVTYPRISIEQVLLKNPDIIIISCMEQGGRFERAREKWLKWKDVPAVKQGRIHLVDSDLLDRPSPRIVQGLETVARLIHPEVKWD
ncbi:MAG: cobalamin-binding protein [Thermodesulfobacteriota bacterium]|nr:cobalamin-binding protein [Thermodesulfobacteriota bacterium]